MRKRWSFLIVQAIGALKRVWKKYCDIEIDSDTFPEIGSEFEKTGQVTVAQVGLATTRLFRQRPAIDFATEWFTRKQ